MSRDEATLTTSSGFYGAEGQPLGVGERVYFDFPEPPRPLWLRAWRWLCGHRRMSGMYEITATTTAKRVR